MNPRADARSTRDAVTRTAATPGPRPPTTCSGIVQDAINRADLEAFLDAHEDDATVVVPLDGRIAYGREQIRQAMAPLLALQPRVETVVVQKLEGPRVAVTHDRWRLTINEDGCRVELSGLGTIVSRRRADGVWRIVLDDPLTRT